MTYVIAQPCVDLKDKACIEECPVDCIYEGERSLYIHPDECVDCGACEPVCPVEAIYYEDDVPGAVGPSTTRPTSSSSTTSAAPAGAASLWSTSPRTTRSSPTCPRRSTTSKVLRLPDFPWDSLAPTKERASAFSDRRGRRRGPGRPVGRHSGRPHPRRRARGAVRRVRRPWLPPDLGHRGPARGGGRLVRRPARGARRRPRRGAPDHRIQGLVAWLPLLLGLGPAAYVVAFPRVAYPTYDVGARLAGSTPVAVDALTALGPPTAATTPKLLWLNTPGNPTGKVLGIEHLAKVVSWARQHGVVVASDECYAEALYLAAPRGRVPRAAHHPVDPRPTGHRRLARGPAVRLLAVEAVQPGGLPRGVRRGRPGPGRPPPRGAQARRDDGAVARAARRARSPVRCRPRGRAEGAVLQAPYALLPAFEQFGLRVDDSEAGLYLWATAGEPGRVTIERLADRGILAAPETSTAEPGTSTCASR